ncbi:MAG: protoheme IX farnesyltransferase [Ignavibacteria bacterium]|jgi:protoheme IX farnesyltransferase
MKLSNDNITTVTPLQIFTVYVTGKLSLLAEIVKIRITILVSLTTALGYFIGVNKLTFDFIYPVIGIYMLACGSAALNQYQERNTDVLMDRTKNRPIPSGKIKSVNVLMISLVLLLIGSGVLIIKTNVTTLLIGLLAFYWYNGVYTPLKKKTALAIIPGSLVGALPPLAGWAATGGNIFDLRILYIALYFFIWQIPHFWLLLLVYGEDFAKGRFPVLTNKISKKGIVSITFLMLLFTVTISIIIPVFNILYFNLTYVLLLILSVFMFYVAYRFLSSDLSKREIMKTFIGINIYTMFFITLLIADKFIFIMFK